jgi:hypothetical protein
MIICKDCRVYISYSHSDRNIVDRLSDALEQAGVRPMWDRDLEPGTGFSEQIQSFITNAHVFLPLITPNSDNRPWLHQEIGYAVALGKPVIPVTTSTAPEGLISGVQSVQLQADLADASEKLTYERFERLVEGARSRPALFECTEDNFRRALLLASYADTVWKIGKYGQVCQTASLTTFHLPERGEADPIWRSYFPATPDNNILFHALHCERVSLQRHAQARGCQLILDPVHRLDAVYHRHGPASVNTRVKGLIRFLRDDSITNVAVAINDDEDRKRSITLIGNWFSSEAVSSGETRLLREALFTRDAQTVRQQILDFDDRMKDLLAARGWDKESSRANTIDYLQTFLNSRTNA